MIKNSGVSTISLVITILVIIIIAAISTPLLSTVMEDNMKQDAKTELKNVENVVDYARTQIMTDKFVPNRDYIITDNQLNAKFGTILTQAEINHIKEVNNDDSISTTDKYFLMDQEKFDKEFGNGFNVSRLRSDREYLISYVDGLVVANFNGAKVTNGNPNSIVPAEAIERGDVIVTFSPNGNAKWKKVHDTNVVLWWNESTTSVSSVSYVWSESVSQPAESLFTNSLSMYNGGAGQMCSLGDETGNGWYLWVKITYTESVNSSVVQTKYVRSDAFFVDNIAPTATFTIDEIK